MTLVGEIADVADEQRRIDVGSPHDRQLDRELRSVAAQRRQLDAAADDERLARCEIAAQSIAMRLAKSRRYDQIGEKRAACRGAWHFEGALRRSIEGDDASVAIDDDDGIERSVERDAAAVEAA